MVHQSPLIVFGTGGIGYAPPEAFLPTMEVLEKYGVKDLDTAFIYVGGSSSVLDHITLRLTAYSPKVKKS